MHDGGCEEGDQRGDSRQGGEPVQRQDAAASRQPEAYQAVRDVVGVASPQGDASLQADEDHGDEIVEGHTEDDQGSNAPRQRGRGDIQSSVQLVADEGGGGADGEPQEEPTRVTHENAGRGEVVEQEAGGCSCEGQAERGCGPVVGRHCQETGDRQTDDGQASGQSIHVVQEVEGVGQRDDPDDGSESGDQIGRTGNRSKQSQPKSWNAGDEVEGGHRLHGQAQQRRKATPVVDQSHREDRTSAQEQGGDLICFSCRQADQAPLDESDQQGYQGQSGTGKYGNATPVGYGARVGLVGPLRRIVHQSHA